jgi:predicted RNA-binding protein with PIN domain
MKTITIIDGYNAVHRVPAWAEALESSLEEGREALLRYCSRWMRQRGDVWLFYVVFDGDSSVPHSQTSYGEGVRVIFTPSAELADDRILQIVREWGDTARYTVVSDDNYVKRVARQHGAALQSVDAFADVLDGTGASGRRTTKARGDAGQAADDKTLSPAEEESINASLRREWGLL